MAGRPVYKSAILAVKEMNPKWTHRQIAELVGCSPRTVSYTLTESVRLAQAKRNTRYQARLRARN